MEKVLNLNIHSERTLPDLDIEYIPKTVYTQKYQSDQHVNYEFTK